MADAPADTAEKPPQEKKSFLAKLGAAIPVALTAIATILAGMSTGALSQSMYWRSTAAQDQAKVNDQWAFAQAKRVRSQVCYEAKRVLEGIAGYVKVTVPKKTDEPAEVTQVGKWLGSTGEKPEAPPADMVTDAAIVGVLQHLHHRDSEADILKEARKVKAEVLEKVLADATTKALAVENAWKDERDAARKETTTLLKALADEKDDEKARAAAAAKVSAARAIEDDIDDRRYRAESSMNFWVGYLYEVRVKSSTSTSDSHLRRSQNFFVAMLVAQIGSVLASLGMNRKKGSLSAVALLAGMVAIGFGAYVFLTM